MSQPALRRYVTLGELVEKDGEYSDEWTEVFKAADIEQVLKPFLQEFIEWNACVAKDYEKGEYICVQCDYPTDKGHEEGCLVIEAKRLLTRLTEGA